MLSDLLYLGSVTQWFFWSSSVPFKILLITRDAYVPDAPPYGVIYCMVALAECPALRIRMTATHSELPKSNTP